ncbi:MAG: 3-isopropylmalate dehydrogenase [Anaerolineae bacterium]|nr:3-isopropylmalate dehydrogenase [Anaerolineae bacterium]
MKARITVLPGDGIGPEVTGEAVKVLEHVGQVFGHEFEFKEALLGGCAIDATGTALPDETVAACRAADAVLLGAVGGPKWDDPTAKVRPEQGLLGIRKALGLFANLRPVKLFPELLHASTLRPETLAGVDVLVVRELTGGVYFGPREEAGEDGSRAYDTMLYTRPEIERVVRLAAKAAQGRRGQLTSVDKANVLASSRLWRRVATEVVESEFPDVRLEHILVDAAAMHLIRQPSRFDVIVTGNLFGDILTDEASMLAGSMGMLPSASLGEDVNSVGLPRGLYEPIHGSAPDIAGQGVANPLAAILSAAMLLRHSLGLEQEAKTVEEAVSAVLSDGYRTADIARSGERTVGTEEMGTAVRERIR